MIQRTLLRKLVIRVCAGAIICLFGAFLLFTLVIYPFHGLKGLERDQYEAAIMEVAKDFAVSESLVASSLERSRFEAVGEKDNAYAWGSVSLLTPDGGQAHLWVSLRWSALWHRWHRGGILILADPRDKLFFAERMLSLGSVEKTLYALENAKRGILRQIREVLLDINPS